MKSEPRFSFEHKFAELCLPFSTMASSTEIKKWIREIKVGKSISDDAILIQKSGLTHTRITILDACCSPHFTIEKLPGLIEKEDIEAKGSLINHQH